VTAVTNKTCVVILIAVPLQVRMILMVKYQAEQFINYKHNIFYINKRLMSTVIVDVELLWMTP